MDEDAMDWQLVQALRARDVDVITVGEVETTGIRDEEQLILANEQGRVLYTFNVGDFCRLHSIYMVEENSHAGIVIGTQQQYSVGQQLRAILKLIATKSAEEMIDQLVYLSSYISHE
jgi:Domain of unknown function (DUF5615)